MEFRILSGNHLNRTSEIYHQSRLHELQCHANCGTGLRPLPIPMPVPVPVPGLMKISRAHWVPEAVADMMAEGYLEFQIWNHYLFQILEPSLLPP